MRGSGFSLSDGPRPPGRSIAFAVGWSVVAAIATAAEMYVAVHLGSVAWRIVIAVILVLVSTTALMLASDNFECCLAGRLAGWSRALRWLTTSVVVLTWVVILGAGATLLFPDRPGTSSLVTDLLVDLAVGVLAGIIATASILIAADVLGRAIWKVQSFFGRTERWRTPPFSWPRLARGLGRAVAMGLAGLLLSAVYTAVATTLTSNPTGGPDAPVPRDSSFVLFALLPVLIWLAGTAGAWLAFNRWRPAHHPRHPGLVHGTPASALSIFFVIVAAWITAASLEATARHQLYSGRSDPVPAVAITDQQASLSSPYLAQRFEPQLWLAKGEHWSPTEVTSYLQHSKLNTDPPFCSTNGGCYEITPPAGSTEQACDNPDPQTACAPSGADDPALYYRYVNSSNANPRDHRPAVPAGSWTVIQYWVFYNYDSLDTASITQWHQSDWEQVSVLVRRQGSTVRPVEVAFSEHCYGALLPAERVIWSGSHPVAYVGLGSHAHYPRPVSVPVRQLRCSLAMTPRYFGVAGLFFSPALDGSRLEIPVAYLGGLRDQTSRIRPTPPLGLVAMDAVPAIASFKGAWGLNNNLSLFGSSPVAESAGPPAPQTQGPWSYPFSKMLCNGDWLSAPGIPRWVCH